MEGRQRRSFTEESNMLRMMLGMPPQRAQIRTGTGVCGGLPELTYSLTRLVGQAPNRSAFLTDSPNGHRGRPRAGESRRKPIVRWRPNEQSGSEADDGRYR
jgi:hypothetical protein